MFSSSRTNRFSPILSTLGFLSLTVLQAQTSSNTLVAQTLSASNIASAAPLISTGSTTPPSPSIPTTTPQWHETVVPANKQISAKITSGVLTVDGLVAKVRLNYDIHHANYMYFFVPGVGTAVVSRVEMFGSSKVPNALRGNTLAFNVGGHDFELTSETAIAEGKSNKSDVYVRFDTQTVALDRMPMMGFGNTTLAPYVWPLSGQEAKEKEPETHFVAPPSLPASVLPRTVPSASTASTSAANDQTVKQ